MKQDVNLNLEVSVFAVDVIHCHDDKWSFCFIFPSAERARALTQFQEYVTFSDDKKSLTLYLVGCAGKNFFLYWKSLRSYFVTERWEWSMKSVCVKTSGFPFILVIRETFMRLVCSRGAFLISLSSSDKPSDMVAFLSAGYDCKTGAWSDKTISNQINYSVSYDLIKFFLLLCAINCIESLRLFESICDIIHMMHYSSDWYWDVHE